MPAESPIRERAFLVGCPRSGTTLLQSYLAAHPSIASFPETHVFVHLVRPWSRWRWLARAGIASSGGRRRFLEFCSEIGRMDLAAFWPPGTWSMRRCISSFIAALDSLATEAGKNRWVEKTPNHVHHVDVIERYVKGARFIHIVREGADVVASLQRVTRSHPRVWHGAWDLDRCVDAWNHAIRETRRHRGKPNHVIVRYEELVAEPARVLDSVFEFLGVEYTPAIQHRRSEAAATLILPIEEWKRDVLAQVHTDCPVHGGLDPEQRRYIELRLDPVDPCAS